MELFRELENCNREEPLAEKLRPKTLSEFLGQQKILSKDSAVYRLITSNHLFSLVFWGPPGCGKTTLAKLIANCVKAKFVELSAVSSGIKDIKEIVNKAKSDLVYNNKTVLFIDEIHRYSKTQQDALLPYIENGTIYLIGSTTENPSFQLNRAILSRVKVIQLNSIDDKSLKSIVIKGFKYLEKTYNQKIHLESGILEFIVKYACGDARCALNVVEYGYFCAKFKDNEKYIKIKDLEELTQQSATGYSIQQHYDFASAFQKSLRGSDKNAAVYYLAQMILAGEDPRFIARRLIICASEDVGNKDPNALIVALNAFKAVELVGFPEGAIILAQAVEYVSDAPKSNKSSMAISKALQDIKSGNNFMPPNHLKDCHYSDAKKYGFGNGYVYTHNNPDFLQQFLPDEIKDKNYFD